MNKKAVYAGSFDPITNGHIDLIKRALKVFDKIVIAVAEDSPKDSLFGVEERLDLIRKSTRGLKGIEVESFRGLAVNYVKSKRSCIIMRGIRMLSDFEYEFQMALTNRRLKNDVETIFLMPNESYSYLSSKLIKEAAALGADIKSFVPRAVKEALKKKFKNNIEG